MTIDEAIKHCEEKAKELRTDYENYKRSKEKYGSEYYREVPIIPTECLECAKEHEQLAEWLKELKALKGRPQGEWVRKKDVIHSIAKQFSEHNELVPIWLSIGDIKGGAE